jgi:hypothetical protein
MFGGHNMRTKPVPGSITTPIGVEVLRSIGDAYNELEKFRKLTNQELVNAEHIAILVSFGPCCACEQPSSAAALFGR